MEQTERVINMESKEKTLKRELTDKDFYDKAYEYFSYHANQRTNMINYFIGVFGAALALYGAMIKYPMVCVCISGFMLAVSVLFFQIDIRTKFDIKHSEKVLCQIEKDYGVDRGGEGYPYGVFSNESNNYEYFDSGYRRKRGDDWKQLKASYRKYKKGKITKEEMDQQIVAFMGARNVPLAEIYDSLNHPSIAHLSTSIAWLYRVCIAVSAAALLFAIIAL